MKGGRGSASFVAKCKMCGRENSIDIIKDSITPYNTNESFKTIVVFECRGVEPVDFSPRVCLLCYIILFIILILQVGFRACGEATFEDVSLTDLVSNNKPVPLLSYFRQEWTEYDEKANLPVSILEIEHKFIKL